MKKEDLDIYMNKKVAVFPDASKLGTSGSKFWKGKVTKVTDTSLTVLLDGCSFSSEICIDLGGILYVTLSKK